MSEALKEQDNGTVEPPEAVQNDQKAQLLALLKSDPDIAAALVRTAASTPEGRELLSIPVGKGDPTGEYRRDYRAPELRVHGGTEVEHPASFTPLPPSYIKPFLRADGTETVYADPYVERQKKSVPLRDDNGKIVVNEEGTQIHTEQWVDVVVDPGAAKDASGRPIKTRAYRMWLDAKMAGQRLDSEVTSQIAAGHFAADGGPVVSYTQDGAPVAAGEGVDIGGELAE